MKARNIVGQDLLTAPEEVSRGILITGPLGELGKYLTAFIS